MHRELSEASNLLYPAETQYNLPPIHEGTEIADLPAGGVAVGKFDDICEDLVEFENTEGFVLNHG
jgi:hypothetical protein